MDHLEQPCGTLTTTYAHCDHDILGFAATAFDKRMADQARAGHAERMAYGYGAAIDIQAFARNSKAIAAVDGLHGKRLIQLPKRSEEHTSELQSLMRISYAVFCLKKKNNNNIRNTHNQ